MSTYEENTTFNCPVERTRGDADTVALSWLVLDSSGGLADEDFVQATGELVFIPGERFMVSAVHVTPLDNNFDRSYKCLLLIISVFSDIHYLPTLSLHSNKLRAVKKSLVAL